MEITFLQLAPVSAVVCQIVPLFRFTGHETHLAVSPTEGPPGSPVTDRGYRVIADRDGKWQVRLASTQAGVFAARPDTGPLYIASENTAAPTQANQMRAPFLGQIQEVLRHSKPLSEEEIANHVDINK